MPVRTVEAQSCYRRAGRRSRAAELSLWRPRPLSSSSCKPHTQSPGPLLQRGHRPARPYLRPWDPESYSPWGSQPFISVTRGPNGARRRDLRLQARVRKNEERKTAEAGGEAARPEGHRATVLGRGSLCWRKQPPGQFIVYFITLGCWA